MYKVRYITTSEVTAVRYVFEEKEIEAADDADAIARFDAECTTPLRFFDCHGHRDGRRL